MLDFDAPNIDKYTGLMMWLGGYGFFGTVFFLVWMSDPASMNPTVRFLDFGRCLTSISAGHAASDFGR